MRALASRARVARSPNRAFTLIELLVVIAIIAVLASIVAVGLIPLKKKAYKEKSKSLLQRLQTALDSYYNEFRDYPPDGFDKEPGIPPANVTAAGLLIQTRNWKSTGCLIYFLHHPINNVTLIGADLGGADSRQLRESTLKPFLAEMPKENFSTSHHTGDFDSSVSPRFIQTGEFQAGWENAELLDAWFRPMHYDKVREPDPGKLYFDKANNPFVSTPDKVHPDATYLANVTPSLTESDENVCPNMGGAGEHKTFGGSMSNNHVDPRSAGETDGCIINTSAAPTAPRNKNSFDLWSHGSSYTNGRETISNWR